MPSHECPSCGDSFDSRRGLGVHHSSIHGERLPNRTCSACGTEFYCSHSKKYCSDACRDDAVSFEGAENPNYRNAAETTHCELCGTEFEYYPSEKPEKFCANCVENESWRAPFDIDGEKNPRWNGGKTTVSCDGCGTTVERHPSGITGEVTLCGRECLESWLSEAFTGEGHPNWRGGSTAPYGKGWNEVRNRVLERDDHACIVCGTDDDELGRNPDVHHLVPVRLFVESSVLAETDAHTVDNAVTVCPSCHRRAEFGHISRAELEWRAGIERVVPDRVSEE